MTIRLDEAIKTAVEFEQKVLHVCRDAEKDAVDPVGSSLNWAKTKRDTSPTWKLA